MLRGLFVFNYIKLILSIIQCAREKLKLCFGLLELRYWIVKGKEIRFFTLPSRAPYSPSNGREKSSKLKRGHSEHEFRSCWTAIVPVFFLEASSVVAGNSLALGGVWSPLKVRNPIKTARLLSCRSMLTIRRWCEWRRVSIWQRRRRWSLIGFSPPFAILISLPSVRMALWKFSNQF